MQTVIKFYFEKSVNV